MIKLRNVFSPKTHNKPIAYLLRKYGLIFPKKFINSFQQTN